VKESSDFAAFLVGLNEVVYFVKDSDPVVSALNVNKASQVLCEFPNMVQYIWRQFCTRFRLDIKTNDDSEKFVGLLEELNTVIFVLFYCLPGEVQICVSHRFGLTSMFFKTASVVFIIAPKKGVSRVSARTAKVFAVIVKLVVTVFSRT
jgi:hypothetical protein